MKNSKETASQVVAYIKANPSVRKARICAALGITLDQFQAATPYIKTECERVRTEWCVKLSKL